MNTEYGLHLKSNKNYPIFAIGEIRVCNEKEILVNKKKFSHQESNITCSTLNGSTKIKWRQLEQQPSNYACPKGSFGENCNIQCLHVINGSCKGMQICNKDVCSCLPGYSGERCEHECQRGTYGNNCEQQCSAYCPNPLECDHINGSCTQNRCNPEVYEPPTCKYPRFRVAEPPQVIKIGMDKIEFNLPLRRITARVQIFKYIKQFAVQYRLHQIQNQSTENWQEGDRLPFLDLYGEQPGHITLSGLVASSSYDIRVILYDENGNGNDGDQVPILFNVTTLSILEEDNAPTNTSTTTFAVIIILIVCASLSVIVGITYVIIKKRRATPAIDDVIYDEIDLNRAVSPTPPEPPPRVREHDAHGYLVIQEPYHYDVVREPQPLWPWIKRFRFPRRFIQRNVDREGYEVPVTHRNVAEVPH